jgi:DNA-binding NarL/FixJ family response regulator
MKDSNRIKIVISDSQFLIAEGLKSVLKTEDRFFVQETVATKTDLFRVLKIRQTDLLIADFSVTTSFGAADLFNLKQEHPALPVLVLTNSLSKAELNKLLEAGIRNIVYKIVGQEELLTAIDFTLKGKKYYCEQILDLLLEPLSENKSQSDKIHVLTGSEIEIVKLIASGLTAKEIAIRKNLSIHTVNTHRKNIFRKTEVSNVSELIMVAIKAGWIDNIEYYI